MPTSELRSAIDPANNLPTFEGRPLHHPDEPVFDQGLAFDVETLVDRREALKVFGTVGLGLRVRGRRTNDHTYKGSLMSSGHGGRLPVWPMMAAWTSMWWSWAWACSVRRHCASLRATDGGS